MRTILDFCPTLVIDRMEVATIAQSSLHRHEGPNLHVRMECRLNLYEKASVLLHGVQFRLQQCKRSCRVRAAMLVQ